MVFGDSGSRVMLNNWLTGFSLAGLYSPWWAVTLTYCVELMVLEKQLQMPLKNLPEKFQCCNWYGTG